MVRKLYVLKKLCPRCGGRLYNKVRIKKSSVICRECNIFYGDISSFEDYITKMDNSKRKERYRETKKIDVDFIRRMLEDA